MYIKGEKCKYSFVTLINGQKHRDLLPNIKKFIKELFPHIRPDDVIFCSYINNGKVDIEIKCQNECRRIMIKAGKTTCLHTESISSFVDFLFMIHVPQRVIMQFVEHYHSSDANIISVSKCLSENFFAKPIINRVLGYDYYQKKIDYLYYGNVLSGAWIKIDDLKETLLTSGFAYCGDNLKIGKICVYKSKDNKLNFMIGNLYHHINKKCKSNP